MESSLSRRQLLALGTVSFLAPALRFYPSESVALAGRAAWTAALLALPLMLGYCLFLTRLLALRREGQGLAELTRRLGGGFGPVLLGLAALWALLYASFVLRSGADRLVGTVYPGASPLLFSQLMGLIALAAALSSPRTLVRMGRMLLPLLFGVLGALLFCALLKASPGNLLPVGAESVLPLAKALPLPLDICAGAGTALCFLAGGLREKEPRFSVLAMWTAGICALLTLVSAAVIGQLGADLTAQLARPFFVLVRTLVFFRTVERVEALVVMLWIFSDFLMTALFLWAGQYSLRLLCGYRPDAALHPRFDFGEGRVLIWAFGAAATVLALFLAPQPASLERWSTLYIPAANLGFVFLFLPFIYIVGRND